MNDEMSFNAYLIQVSYYLVEHHGSMRVGQCYFNVLSSVRPDLTHLVVSSDRLDPFYKDYALPEFLTWVSENWSNS